MNTIYGSRIRQAREFAGKTQAELAKLAHVNQSAIAQMEADRFAPTPEVLQAIGEATGFLPAFFEKEPVESLPFGSLAFRARKALTAREEKRAYQYANTLFEQAQRMAQDKRIQLRPVHVPQLKEMPEVAALITRTDFGLGPDMPIGNLMNVLEKAGVLFIPIPILLPNMDAFSVWAELDSERPVIAIVPNKPMDRTRFSIAHELGHLVLHRTARGHIANMEKEANTFARSFLMPEMAMRREAVTPLTLSSIARLKSRWGVSMQAIIYHSRELGIISPRQAKYLFSQMAAHGWRKREPANLDVRPEVPQILRKMIETLYPSPEAYGEDMGLASQSVMEIVLFAS